MAGYSETPLVKKLGLREGHSIHLVNVPDNYTELIGGLPHNVRMADAKKDKADFIHVFVYAFAELQAALPLLKTFMNQQGMIWVSWPKKASGVATDVTEDSIRSFAISLGLVDVKVCAVDDTWSALKLVIPVKHRTV